MSSPARATEPTADAAAPAAALEKPKSTKRAVSKKDAGKDAKEPGAGPGPGPVVPKKERRATEEKNTEDPAEEGPEGDKRTAAKKRKTTGHGGPRDHPSFEEIIRECIRESKEDRREGVSRPTIKKFMESRYGLEMTSLTVANINRAILKGQEKGVFELPKGPSGKVKLAKAAEDKENEAPVGKATSRVAAMHKAQAKREREAARAAARAAAPKAKKPAPKPAPALKNSTNARRGSGTGAKAAASKTTTKKGAPTTAARKKKVERATAAVATKSKREGTTRTRKSAASK